MEKIYKVIADYSMILKDLIRAGKYGCCSNYFASNQFKWDYPPEKPLGQGKYDRKYEMDLILVDSQSEVADLNLRPADFIILLCFGSTYPKVQLEFPIIASGTTFHIVERDWYSMNGVRVYPFLSSFGKKGRSLEVVSKYLPCAHMRKFDVNYEIPSNSRFLAVQNCKKLE